eukprot:m.246542 g.246542  ORF g.246542 m.246542 type:complete len:398 (-) comp15076_c0_seq1:700-1893(-)
MMKTRRANNTTPWPAPGPSKTDLSFLPRPHLVEPLELAELVQLMQALREPRKRCKERHQLVAAQAQVGHRLVTAEENLHGGAEPLDLDLAPHAALLAAHAVHDARDVLEALAELQLQVGEVALEHLRLVEGRRAFARSGDQLGDQAQRQRVLRRVAAAQHARRPQRRALDRGTQQQQVREVHVAQARGALAKGALRVEEEIEESCIGPPHCLPQGEYARYYGVRGCDVQVDARMEAGYDAVEDPLLDAHAADDARCQEGVGVQVVRLEAVLAVHGAPDAAGRRAHVAGVALGVVQQVHVLAVVALVFNVAEVELLVDRGPRLERRELLVVDRVPHKRQISALSAVICATGLLIELQAARDCIIAACGDRAGGRTALAIVGPERAGRVQVRLVVLEEI